jgi:hypothetical protein
MYNDILINSYAEYRNNKQYAAIQKLKIKLPDKSDDVLLEIYNLCISQHQSRQQGSGNFLETHICEILIDNNIPFKSQVSIDAEGVIIRFNNKAGVAHVVDIVIGGDIIIGKSITEFDVISCKTTCRERWTQDKWSLVHKPCMFILATLSDDYPPSKRFNESETRKIITSNPKLKDDRLFKLNFNDLLHLLV